MELHAELWTKKAKVHRAGINQVLAKLTQTTKRYLDLHYGWLCYRNQETAYKMIIFANQQQQ